MAELLIGMGIFSILIVVLSELFGGIMTMKLKGESVSAVSADSRFIMTRLSYDVARASSVVVPNSTTLNLTIAGEPYSYSVSSNILRLSYNGGSSEVLHSPSTRIANLSFTKLDDLDGKQSVRVDMDVESTILLSGGKVDTRNLISTYATR